MSSARSRAVAWLAAGVLGGAVVTGVVVSQLTAATAATPTPAPGQTQQYGPGGTGMRPAGGVIGRFGGLGRIAHGELTVRTGTNTYEVVFVQNGAVTAVDTAAKRLTVKSSDGQSFTYVIGAATVIHKNGAAAALSDLKIGDTVHVTAVKASDGTLTARTVRDGRAATRGGMAWRHRGWGRGGGQGQAPNGSTPQGSSAPGAPA